MCSARNSIGYEIDKGLQPSILERITDVPEIANQIMRDRVDAHNDFVKERQRSKGRLKYTSRRYGFPVMTRQEEDLCLYQVQNIQYQSSLKFRIEYLDLRSNFNLDEIQQAVPSQFPEHSLGRKGRQLKMF